MAQKLPPEKDIEAAGRELKESPPEVVSHTRRKFGPKAAESQRRAIMFSKARKSAGRRRKRRMKPQGRSMRSRR